jgi:hypothetical protein
MTIAPLRSRPFPPALSAVGGGGAADKTPVVTHRRGVVR